MYSTILRYEPQSELDLIDDAPNPSESFHFGEFDGLIDLGIQQPDNPDYLKGYANGCYLRSTGKQLTWDEF